MVAALAALLSAGAIWFCFSRGWLLYYGDANAHLNIARRVLDSRTPGYDQLGTVWLPLPHALIIPFARNGDLWRSGLAGAIPSALCFVLACVFLFCAARRIFGETAAAAVTVAAFALNPNLLYLQSTAMTEPVFFAALLALLYFVSRESAVGAGVAAMLGTLARYDGWILLPVVALWFLTRRVRSAFVFGAIASLGPLYWLAHNWWCCGDSLAFFNGPYSAKAIQGAAPYPGLGDWRTAWLYFRTAVQLSVGWPLVAVGAAGLAVAARRSWIATLLLILPSAFYVWSIHSFGTPIFVPTLAPHSYYNTRYGLAALPLLALGAGALLTLAPARRKGWVAAAVAAAAIGPWLLRPQAGNWITWKESEVNSVARREWTSRAAAHLGPRYRAGEGIFTTFGDVTGIYREMGIPLERTLTWDNWPVWPAATVRPELFLRERWAVAIAGDAVQAAILKAGLRGPRYALEETIAVKGAPVVEIYRLDTAPETLAAVAAVPPPGREEMR